MKKNLEAQHKELEEKRRQFEDEKANWEAQQRILEQQNSSRYLMSDFQEICVLALNNYFPIYFKNINILRHCPLSYIPSTNYFHR